MTETVQINTSNKAPRKVKFIDVNRDEKDTSYLPVSSSIALITKAGDGLTIIFKERLSYVNGDKLLIKFDDTYGNVSNEESSE